jgi:hypothetical protein
VRPDRVGLKHHAEIALVGRDENAAAARIDDAAGDLDLARGRPLQAGDRAERRGLAAARRPEQREQLALRHFERDVLRGLHHGAVLTRVFGVQRFDPQHVRPLSSSIRLACIVRGPLSLHLSMIFSENRFPLFRIML